MTEDEIKKANSLDGCVFLPGSVDKRFVKNIVAMARDKPHIPLSVKQWFYLETLYHKYRGQIKANLAWGGSQRPSQNWFV